MKTTELSLEKTLEIARDVTVSRENFSWPPKFAITVYAGHKVVTFRGFSSRSAAWEAVEAVSSVRRPTPKPDQDRIDNLRWPDELSTI